MTPAVPTVPAALFGDDMDSADSTALCIQRLTSSDQELEPLIVKKHEKFTE
jgi:hypothetical protein